MVSEHNSEAYEVFWAAWIALNKWRPRVSRGSCVADVMQMTAIQAKFLSKLEELERQERKTCISEKQLGRAVMYGGANGLASVMKEYLLMPEEKAKILAGLLIDETARLTESSLDDDAKTILCGILSKSILEAEQAIRLRVGEEPGIAY